MKILKKCLVLFLMLGITISSSLQTNAESTKYIRGTFTFGAHDSNHDLTDSYIYTDDFFKESADNNDLHLAIMSMVMASASISSKDVDYVEKSRNIQDLLNQIGFQNISVNDYYKEKMDINTMGAAVGYKYLDDNSVLLAIIPRSAGYESEWGGNFNIGKEGLHEGFKTGRDIILDFTKDYVSNNLDAFKGKTVKVWTMGYSRGAGVANQIGAALVDDSNDFIGLTVSRDNIYTYTFGTPYTASKDLNPRDSKYNNIHNYYADYDLVAMLPLSQWNFDRFGQDTYLDVHNADTKTKMLSLLKETNPYVYENYTSYDDPDAYQAKTLSYSSEGDFSIVNDDTTSTNLGSFVTERLSYLFGTIVPSREVYVDSYQAALVQATALLVGGDDDVVATFMSGVAQSSSLKPLAIMMYFYNWVDQYTNKDDDLPENWMINTFNMLKPLEDDETTGNETVDAVLKSDLYKEMYTKYITDKLSEGGETVQLKKYGDLLTYYKKICGNYMYNVLSDGLQAIGYSGDELTNHPMIAGDNPAALSVVFAHALFGTNDKASSVEVATSAAINKVKTALTLVGNSCYLRVHNNEVILSWLRAMDTNPIFDDSNDSDEDSNNSDENTLSCEEMKGKNWIWSNSKKACVYKVTNTSSK